ncbi:MAG: PEP-CTERM sorting domain-containing protein [Burkholderiales bacterium]|nr:PEP-CTERM sorting domain-containing protein [Opitutaceae bacterium]
MRKLYTTASLVAILTVPVFGQIWNDGGQDQLWSSSANWSTGAVPTATGAVQIGTQPSGDALVIDTGATSVASFTLNSSLTGPFDIVGAGAADTFQVNGAITNNDDSRHSFLLPFSAGASATWDGPLAFKNIVNIDAFSITVADSLQFTGAINLSITSASVFGRFLGAGTADFTGATINIGSAFSGFAANDTFDFTSGSFTGATLGTLPTLTNGLTWNTTGFLTTGILTVTSAIPEPSTWAALFGVSALGFAACRRRRQAK